MLEIGNNVLLSEESQFYGDEEDDFNPMGVVGRVTAIRDTFSWDLPIVVDWGFMVGDERSENAYAQNDLVIV